MRNQGVILILKDWFINYISCKMNKNLWNKIYNITKNKIKFRMNFKMNYNIKWR